MKIRLLVMEVVVVEVEVVVKALKGKCQSKPFTNPGKVTPESPSTTKKMY